MNKKLAKTVKVFEEDHDLLVEQLGKALNFKMNQIKCLKSSSNEPEYFRQKIYDTIEALNAQLYMLASLNEVYTKCLNEIKQKHSACFSDQQYH